MIINRGGNLPPVDFMVVWRLPMKKLTGRITY
jgi:hypothetical protein